jgi:hypothetical protein
MAFPILKFPRRKAGFLDIGPPVNQLPQNGFRVWLSVNKAHIIIILWISEKAVKVLIFGEKLLLLAG